jgi:hypothetical protein
MSAMLLVLRAPRLPRMDHWTALADLPLVVDSVAYRRLDPGEGFGEAHSTRIVSLAGAGAEGLGEDITLFIGEAPDLALAGEWTLGSFCAHLDELDQWPDGDPDPMFADFAKRWRAWAYESAALDLALVQAGRPLHGVLGLEPRPVTFVNSFGREGEDIVLNATRRLERYPQLRFKLDVGEHWTDEIVDTLAETGAVHTVDFKGRYGLELERPEDLPALYERVLAGFPDALVEDPHDLPDITALVAPHAARVAYDAPIHTVSDLDAQPIPAKTFNIKPSRVGHLRELFALYDECERRGAAMYGGGMGELGVGRGQIQLLASLFSPDGPNDIAPPGYNALVPVDGLPASPLDAEPARVGFRRRGDS